MKMTVVTDCQEFWNKVETNMIMRGFSLNIPLEFQVKPSICNWSSFIGKFTRSNNVMVNTEHRNSHRTTGEVEADCREVSEERLKLHSHWMRRDAACRVTVRQHEYGVFTYNAS